MQRRGIETRFLQGLPQVLLWVVVPAASIAGVTDDGLVRIVALAFMLGWAMALLPVALACLIVCVMKGRARTADSYPLPDPE